MFGSKETESSDNETKKSAILDFNGKKYDMNTLPDDAKEIFNFFDNKYLVNFYGCTENSPRISHFKITKKLFKISDCCVSRMMSNCG